MEEKKTGNKKIVGLLFILLNVAVIAITAYREFASEEKIEIRFGRCWGMYLALAVLCLVISYTAESCKYVLMMQALGGKGSFRDAFETVAVGKYYDSITPTGAGGQPFQVYYLHRHGYTSGASSAFPVIGFVSSQAAYIILALAAFLLRSRVEIEAFRYTAYAGLLCVSFFPCLLAAFTFMPGSTQKILFFFLRIGAKLHLIRNEDAKKERVLRILTGYREKFREISGKPLVVGGLFALSFIYRIGLCSIPFFVLRALGGNVSYFHIFATTLYINVSVSLIPTPGHSGAAEAAFYLIFSEIISDDVFWAMLFWRVLTYYAFIGIGALVIGRNAIRNNQKGRR